VFYLGHESRQHALGLPLAAPHGAGHVLPPAGFAVVPGVRAQFPGVLSPAAERSSHGLIETLVDI
jgi:hypothetical protein